MAFLNHLMLNHLMFNDDRMSPALLSITAPARAFIKNMYHSHYSKNYPTIAYSSSGGIAGVNNGWAP